MHEEGGFNDDKLFPFGVLFSNVNIRFDCESVGHRSWDKHTPSGFQDGYRLGDSLKYRKFSTMKYLWSIKNIDMNKYSNCIKYNCYKYGWTVNCKKRESKYLFPTFQAKFGVEAFGNNSQSRLRNKKGVCKYRYQVKLHRSAGSMQFGICNSMFELESLDNINNIDNNQSIHGVGKDAFSWSIDLSNQKIWHNGESKDYGTRKWKIGDTIGIGLNLQDNNIEFWLNDRSLGIAFENIVTTDIDDPKFSDDNIWFYPCITLSCPSAAMILCDKMETTSRIREQYHPFPMVAQDKFVNISDNDYILYGDAKIC